MNEKWKLLPGSPDGLLRFRNEWESSSSRPSFKFHGMTQVTFYRNSLEIYFSRDSFWSGEFRPISESFRSEELETIHG